jgi:hypothetical protein
MTTRVKSLFLLGAGCWLVYLAILVSVVVYAVLRFNSLYSGESLQTHPELSQLYKGFIGLSGIGLAALLGIVAASCGAYQRSFLQGLAVLVAGSLTTVFALSVMPLIRFAEDAYPAAALWVMGDGLPLLVTFTIASIAGRLIVKAVDLESPPG